MDMTKDRDEYKAENVFFVPPIARWSFLLSNAKLPNIGKIVDEAMNAIEKENNSLRGVLPKVFARDNLDSKSLGGLIDLIGNIAFGDAKARSADVLGHVFEYFLGEFALAEGKQGGQFYTPKSVVELLVKMLEPYRGRVYDPCCGSGGMFVQSEKFVTEHQGKINDIFFIDSRNMGELINRRTKEFSNDDTDYIASVYLNWKNGKEYEDIKGFCKSISLKEVRELSYVLTPGRYVGLEVVDDEFDFKERFSELQKELQEQMKQEQELNKRINENLAKVVVDE
ncbi:MAG: SAM-dependent DNA methyltransferase [Sulfurovum sp.]|nr:SAM-dependent DNA methyltransferase [Sulfurovum sp.]